MQLGFNLWAWTWCNISRPRKSGTLGGETGGTCGTRCPGTFAFLEPKEFLEPVEPVKRMGFHRFHTSSLGSNTQWFHRFQTSSLGSTTLWFHSFQTGFLGSKNARFHRFHAFPGFKNALVPQGSRQVPWLVSQVPDRFLGFNRGTVGIVEGVNFGNYPNCVRLMHHCAAPFLEWAGMGSTGSRQVPWVQPRRWFHRFHTGSLGSTTPWVQQVPCMFLGFNHATGSTGFQAGSLG